MTTTRTYRPGSAVLDHAGERHQWATIDGAHYHEVGKLPTEPGEWLWLQAYEAGRLPEQDGMRPLAMMRPYLARLGAEFADAPLSVLACAACGEAGADAVEDGEPVHARCIHPDPSEPDPDPTWGHGPGTGPVRC